MTVAELIAKLQEMPQHLTVVHYESGLGLERIMDPRVRVLRPDQYDMLDDRTVQTEMSVVEIT